VRGGYSLSFVNEEGVTVSTNILGGNAGLATATALSSLYGNYSAGVPEIPTPTFKTVRTLPDQMALSATAPMAIVDPDIQQSKVHQVSIGVSRELPWWFAAEARYVGCSGAASGGASTTTRLWCRRPSWTTSCAHEATATWPWRRVNPSPRSTIPPSRSVPLTVLPTYGLLTNSNVITRIQQNESAGLADYYVTQRVAGALKDFYPNPGIYEARAMINDGWQNYNAFQLELRRQYRNGIMGQVNYSFSRTRANSTGGTSQSRLEPRLDNNRPQLDEGRSAYNLTHLINANLIVDLPFGEGRHWLNQGGVVNAIAGGWQLSGVIHWQSGSPVGIYSTRGTFNRANRSGLSTAVTSLSVDQIKALTGVFKEANGNIYWIDPKVIDTTGRAVGADNLGNTAGFNGQVFFNPAAGDVGTLPILAFDAPNVWTSTRRSRSGSTSSGAHAWSSASRRSTLSTRSPSTPAISTSQRDVRPHHRHGGRCAGRAVDGARGFLSRARMGRRNRTPPPLYRNSRARAGLEALLHDCKLPVAQGGISGRGTGLQPCAQVAPKSRARYRSRRL